MIKLLFLLVVPRHSTFFFHLVPFEVAGDGKPIPAEEGYILDNGQLNAGLTLPSQVTENKTQIILSTIQIRKHTDKTVRGLKFELGVRTISVSSVRFQ